MKIKTTHVKKNYWTADFIEFSGMPFIGTGKTEAMAISCLFIRNIEKLNKFEEDNYLEINDKKWEEGIY